MATHVTTGIVGTYGYAAPEYMATSHLYVKNDVYGFGIVLLEILTGRRVLDMEPPSGENKLIDWGMPFLYEKRRLKKIIDPTLGKQNPSKGAFQEAKIVLQCLESEPKNRPSIEEILADLEEIHAIKMGPKKGKDGVKSSKSADSFQNHAGRHSYSHNQSPREKPLLQKSD